MSKLMEHQVGNTPAYAGNTVHIGLGNAIHWNTPARAGNIPTLATTVSAFWEHPRLRAEVTP